MNRSYTSLSTVKDLRRPDRRTPLKVLVSKTFKFVDQLWEMYVTKNKVDLRYVYMEMVLFSLSTNNIIIVNLKLLKSVWATVRM